MPPHLALEHIDKSFAAAGRDLEALADITLDVAAGEFLSVLGPSGCGKTTLLRIAGGLDAPTAGRVSIAGEPPGVAQRSKAIGVVFQEPSLLPWLTVAENVRLPLDVNRRGGFWRRRAAGDPGELLRIVGLADFADFHPHQLSRGMQQRVALARALAIEPPLLLMDEPFASLDEITREVLRYELLRIWEGSGTTVLFVTHSITDAVLLSDRVAILSPRPGSLRGLLPVPLPRPRPAGIERTAAYQTIYREVHAAVMAGVVDFAA
jgi:NitT/TauT family transport system ATP-binding protein